MHEIMHIPRLFHFKSNQLRRRVLIRNKRAGKHADNNEQEPNQTNETGKIRK